MGTSVYSSARTARCLAGQLYSSVPAMSSLASSLSHRAVVAPLAAKPRTQSRRAAVLVASSRGPKKGAAANGAQKFVYKFGSTQAGSAPKNPKTGKPGYVYKLGLKNGKANVDEYSPIYKREEWKAGGEVYEGGELGLKIWLAGFGGLVASGAL